MSVWRRVSPRLVAAFAAAWLTTCSSPPGSEQPPKTPLRSATTEPVTPGKPNEFDQCMARRAALQLQPELPGAPELESVRPEIVARARTAPVLFTERPSAGNLPAEIESLRQRLGQARVPWPVLRDVYSGFRRDKRKLRQVLLTDGYFYADEPELATLLGNHVMLSHLYDAPEIVVVRGSRVLHARKKGLEYHWTDGPEAGTLARLWLFDRVSSSGELLSEPKHISFESLRERTGADSVEVEGLTAKGVLARLVYDEVRVPSVLAVRDGEAELECEAIEPPMVPTVLANRSLSTRMAKVIAHLRQAVAEQVREGLPFDEPKTEEGQQDGKLRQEWRDAYLHGRHKFTFNGDDYFVFGSKGQPRIPQVCVDFVVDTWERLAGTRWLASHEGRGRRVGRIDFDSLEIENRRSVDRLIEFARSRPEWFDVLEYSDAERVPFKNRKRFFKRLYEARRDFQPGDVVAILGLRDDDRLHYHSFIIVSDDPITGMPTAVAANAGRPRVRSWEAEMQNAPKRSIVARIRPRLTWLEALADPSGPGPTSPALSSERQASAVP